MYVPCVHSGRIITDADIAGAAQVRSSAVMNISPDPLLSKLVDWVYLHATEGGAWPSTTTKRALIELALQRAPTQADADALKDKP